MALNNTESDILFYLLQLYSILLCSILLYSILFPFGSVPILLLFYSVLFLLVSVLFLFYSVLFLFYYVLLPFYSVLFLIHSVIILFLFYYYYILFYYCYSITILLCSCPILSCSIQSKSKKATDCFSFSLGRTSLYGDRWRICHVLILWWTDDGCETVTAWVDGQMDGWNACSLWSRQQQSSNQSV